MPERVLPLSLLPPARCERVILHWTAGSYRASGLDRLHYHAILEDLQARGTGGDVRVVPGVFTAQDNDSTRDGRYAAHTARLNTGSFGLAAACMAGAREGGPYGRYPLTFLLWERLAQAAAEVLARYDLPLSATTCLQHGEVGEAYPKAPQAGKWDVLELPWDRSLSHGEVAAQFRRKVAWYLREYHGREASP